MTNALTANAAVFCSHCGGTGIISEQKGVNVKLPPEVHEGQKIRLKGEGKADSYGNKGDLYLKIAIKDSEYQIDGANLTKEVEVSPAEAVWLQKRDYNSSRKSNNNNSHRSVRRASFKITWLAQKKTAVTAT